ncbi:AT-hook motif nuclear-localized protein 17-like [Canna indica]|uniref:AT-hook motif nuclear-localized protein n=1 Tax=Canna indica TaxID=4628 RepID=A0AAQ3KHN4_9LILI|nr:AT-hook motif nuclear-localized protein 17-like [Canna indica]
MKNKPDDNGNGAVPRFHHYLQQQRQQQQKRDCLSDEVDSARSNEEIKKPILADIEHNDEKALVVFASGDGATVEVAKRRRGRPPGSKNKPKPPAVITREAEPPASMRPQILQIPAGHDVADSLARFARRRNTGICVLACTGAVANVTVRQTHFSGAAAGASVCFQGRIQIMSMTATFLPPAMSVLSPGTGGEMSISFAGPQGRVLGGTVMGPLMAAGTVVIVAAELSNPAFFRLSVEDDVSVSVSVSGGGAGGDIVEAHGQEQHVHHQQEDRHRHHHHAAAVSAAEACSMSIFSSGHLLPDVFWTPALRHPPPPPY